MNKAELATSYNFKYLAKGMVGLYCSCSAEFMNDSEYAGKFEWCWLHRKL